MNISYWLVVLAWSRRWGEGRDGEGINRDQLVYGVIDGLVDLLPISIRYDTINGERGVYIFGYLFNDHAQTTVRCV